jgi:hypothetical protein
MWTRCVPLATMLVVGCDAVPDVTFADVDASAVDDAGNDGAISDATSDQPSADQLSPEAGWNTCSMVVPMVPFAYATACCGPVACNGAAFNNCAATCADCLKCSTLDLCCPNAQNKAVCRSTLKCN